MSFKERITLVTVSFRSKSSLENLIKNVPDDYEIIIVDNSQDLEITKEFSDKPFLKILSPSRNLGFGAACNLGAKASSRDYLFFVNPDCILEEKTLEKLYQASQTYKKASAFSPKIIDFKGKQTFKRRSALLNRKEWMSRVPPPKDSEVTVIAGSAFLIEKIKFLSIGGFDENIFLFHEDDDLSIRLRNNIGPLYYIPSAIITHEGGRSSERSPEIASLKGFYMGKSRVYGQKKHKKNFPLIRNFIFSFIQLLSIEMFFSKRKRAKYLSFFKGVLSEINKKSFTG